MAMPRFETYNDCEHHLEQQSGSLKVEVHKHSLVGEIHGRGATGV